MSAFVSAVPKDATYDIKNHNGAVMGFAKRDGSKYWWFYPKNNWTNYSGAQLYEIAKILERLNAE